MCVLCVVCVVGREGFGAEVVDESMTIIVSVCWMMMMMVMMVMLSSLNRLNPHMYLCLMS